MASLTIMNMLIGVICEVVSAVANTETEQLTLTYVKEKIQEIMEATGADDDADHMISKDEFIKLLQNEKAAKILNEVGVDVVGLVDFVDEIFDQPPADDNNGGTKDLEEKKLTFEEFMTVVLELRGSNSATVKDVVQLRKHLNTQLGRLERKLADLRCGVFGSSSPQRSSGTPVMFQTTHTPEKGLLDTEHFKGWPSSKVGSGAGGWSGRAGPESKEGPTFQALLEQATSGLAAEHERE
eukprot:CAMPEP_0179123766 /NCGR_PEP_ID=MMETSP0796-20121207/58462_1 /TAXON_ID=73915 /ORGANISM="Pyrodinium bahamense, Strain pbaha01" /LENGTH=238 /DNA_ID=CAMNT_0020822413 /DNA_START=1 /DNA_END=714 /DNA_ORIENTATION=-